MDIEQILAGLTNYSGLPVETIRAAEASRATAAPAFVKYIEDYLQTDPQARPCQTPLFFIFHLLGAWREKSAYRPLVAAS